MNLPCEPRCGEPVLCQFPVYGTEEEKRDFIRRHPSRYGQSERSKAYDRLLNREEKGARRRSDDVDA
jgi:hypothetical protein